MKGIYRVSGHVLGKAAAVATAVLLANGGLASEALAGSIYVNDNLDGTCTNFTDGMTNIWSHTMPLCTASSVADIGSKTATLVLNDNGTFLKGKLSIDGAFDLGWQQIHSLAAGTQATDAINLAQLRPLITGLGGGAAIDPNSGVVTGPAYQLANGGTQTTVEAALNGLDQAITTNTTHIGALRMQLDSGSVGLVLQDATSKAISVASGSGGVIVSIADAGIERTLTGVKNGVNANDAVTVDQLRAAGLVDADGHAIGALTYDDISLASARLGGSDGTLIRNLAPGEIALDSMDAVNGGQLFELQQRVHSISLATLPGTGTGTGSTASGSNAVASGTGSTATGVGAKATGDNSTATGSGAAASGNSSTAVGAYSQANGNDSVALGARSVADRDNTVSIGAPGNERQLTHVAAATQRTDAANWGQVQDAVGGVQDWASDKFRQLGRSANASTAAAMAMTHIPQAYAPNQSALGAGIGSFKGQSAIAVGMSTITPDGSWVMKGSVTGNTQGDMGVGVGLALVW